MQSLSGRLLLVGAGKMGSALLEGWLKSGLKPEQVTVQEPMPHLAAAHLLGTHNIKPVRQAGPPDEFQVIVLAVKPQALDEVLPPLKTLTGIETTVISIAAGKTVSDLSAYVQPGTPVVRVMPNTPAAIGRGMSVLCASRTAKPGQRALAETLLAAVGETAWVEDEAHMDAVTAISGSGPAYVFYLAEALAEAGRKAGLDADLASKLANATVTGAGALLETRDHTPAELRKNVTSPGGTTEFALKVLMADDGLQPLLDKAVDAAVRRSKELSRKS